MANGGQIRIIPGRIINSSNNTIVFSEGGGDLTATIPAGTYWGGYNATLASLGYNDLYSAIETAMTAAGANTYAITAGTPSQSSQQQEKGLNILSNPGGLAWTLKPTSGSWTFPLELLGLVDNAGYSAADINSVGVSTTEVIILPFCRGAEWFSWNIYTDNGTDRQMGWKQYREVASNSDPLIAYAYTWLDQDSSPDRRRIVINEIPGAHVWGNRAIISSYANTAKLAQGDVNNGFVDTVWQYARTLRGEGVNASDVIIVYDDGWNESGTDIEIPDDKYDIGRIMEKPHRENPNSFLTEIRPNGEFYRMDITFALKTRKYLQ